MDEAHQLYNRVVTPTGAWDLWAGPLRSFQSRARRPEFCYRGLLAVERPAWGDEACKVSKFFKSPHESHFYWPKWFKANILHLQLHKPRKRKVIYLIVTLNCGPGRCKHLKTGKKTFETRGGGKRFKRLPVHPWDSFLVSLTRILTSIHAGWGWDSTSRSLHTLTCIIQRVNLTRVQTRDSTLSEKTALSGL